MSEVLISEKNQACKATSPSFRSKRSSAAPGSIKVTSHSIASSVSSCERLKSTIKESGELLMKETVNSLAGENGTMPAHAKSGKPSNI